MNTISQTLAGLELGKPAAFRNLALFPLLAKTDAAADYLTLDEALETRAAHIAEVSESGSVPELRFIAHLMGVTSLVLEHGADEDVAIAAMLHDAAEDQGGHAMLAQIRPASGSEWRTS